MNLRARIAEFLIGLVTIAALVTFSTPAQAVLNCTVTITDLNFIDIDLTKNTTFDTTGTLTANCTGDAGRTARICPNVNAGSGGSTSGDPRFLLNGATKLNYNLFQDPSRTIVWGSYLWAFPAYTPPPIDIVLTGGSGNATPTVYGRIYAGQQTVAPGTYTSLFAGGETQIAYDYADTGDCAQIGTMNQSTAPFTVTAGYPAVCAMNAGTLDFGTHGVLVGAVNGSSALTATCSATTPYTIALDGGTTAASDPAERKMSKGGEQITYGLYRDAARLQAWGSTTGVDTAGGTGSGQGQNLTVYGRVPAQATPSPGTYTDTIVATITY